MTKWTSEQTEAIYKSGTNIIVSAGAGSGKTAVLTERVLEKVKSGISISNLLILTFTKMAAKEMRERIGSKLIENNLLEEASLLDTADITTFDAYSLSLVKKYHYYLNLSKNISIIDSSVIELYKKKCLDIIFDDLYEREDEDFLKLIKEYSLKDDREIFNFIIDLNNKLDLKLNKREYLNSYIDIKYSDDNISKDIEEFTSVLLGKIDLIRDYLEYIDDEKLLDKLNEVLNPLIESNNYDEIKVNIPDKLPIVKNVSDTSKIYKNKINDLLKEIKKYTSYESTFSIKEGILKTKEFAREIIKIVLKLDEMVSLYKSKYDSYEYSDIAMFAIKLVRENKEIREEIKNSLNEILIDEYQDTNDIQEEFISLISSNNVYMVGDIKQSIYRFRNANPYIFMNKYNNYSKGNNGYKIDLNKNFRSREEVINNINYMFDRIMDEEYGGADYKLSHEMVYGNLMYKGDGDNHQNNDFEVYNYVNDTIYKKEEVEAFIIADDILNKINSGYKAFDKEEKTNRNINYSDFVILMDNSKYFELYKKILEYKGIPTTILKSGNLLDGELIILIKNIINYIIKVKDNVFDTEMKKLYMSLGRSFLYSISDEELFDSFLNKDFINNDIYKIAKEISLVLDDISLIDLIDLIIDKYDIYNKLILIGDYKNNILRIEKLKDIINNLVNLNYSVYDLKDYLNDIVDNNVKIEFSVNDNNDNTVKIMTIHASKGLEFNVCYFSSLFSKFNIREAINKFSYDNKYGIIIPYKDDFVYNTIYHDLSYISYVKENISERIRLLYVALTRAKEKMIFLLPTSSKDCEAVGDIVEASTRSKYSSFASIFYSIEGVINNYYKNIDLSTFNITKDYNLIKNDSYKNMIKDNNSIINVDEVNINYTEEKEDSFSKKSNKLIDSTVKDNMEYGIKVHELFELTDFYNPNYTVITDKEKTVIDNFLSKVDINKSKIYKEYEFIYEIDNTLYHGIIDLMLVYENHIKIIDYKLSNIEDAEYIKQLSGYKDYIESRFNKKTYIYLYSIMNNELREIGV